MEDSEEGQAQGKRIRADARRNEDAVLEAAKQVFAASGVDAPVREIAARAGVGVGTLYRRFPKRADLVAAVFRREVDACAAEAGALAATHPPLEALTLWLKRFTIFITAKKGLAAALHSGDPVFDALPDHFRTSFEPALTGLLNRAAEVGAIRADVDPFDLLRAVANVSGVPAGGGRSMVDLLIDGLRYGATGAAGFPD